MNFLSLIRKSKPPNPQQGKDIFFVDDSGTLKKIDPDGNISEIGALANVISLHPSDDSLPLRIQGGPDSYDNNGNLVEWYKEDGSFLGSIQARGGAEFDLGDQSLVIYDDSFNRMLNVGGNAVIICAASGTIGFFGSVGHTKPTVTGSKGGNAALGSLISALASLGLITDSTS